MDVDTNNGWKQTIYCKRERKMMSKRRGTIRKRMRTRKSKVWRMLSMLTLLRVFPFPSEMCVCVCVCVCVCDIEKLLRPDQHKNMMLKQNQSLTDLDSAVAQL